LTARLCTTNAAFLVFLRRFSQKNKKRGISSSLRALPSLQPTYAASLFNCSNVIC